MKRLSAQGWVKDAVSIRITSGISELFAFLITKLDDYSKEMLEELEVIKQRKLKFSGKAADISMYSVIKTFK